MANTVSAQVRGEKEAEVIAGLGRVVDKAIAETEDRLEHGDVYVHQGQITRAPVKAKDAVLIAAVAVDKGLLIQNKPTRVTAASDGMQALLAQFEELARTSRTRVVSEQ